MAEDKTSLGSNADIDEKPRRTRKRKIETDKMSEQAFQVAANMQQADVILPADTPAAVPPTANPTDFPETAADATLTDTPSAPVMAFSSGCGGALKAAREAQGLSIREVSSQLRLGVNQIQAIEQDDFGQLPQQSIVRGFIRNYAKLLKIDVEPVLSAYQHLVPSEAPVTLSVRSTGITPTISHTAKIVRPQRIVILLGLLLLVAVLAYFYVSHIKPQSLLNLGLPLKAESPTDIPTEAVTLPEPTVTAPPVPETPVAEPVALPAAPLPAVASEPAPVVPVPVAPVITAPSVPAAPIAATAALTTQVSTPTPAVEGATGITTLKAVNTIKTELTFKVREDSWIRIEDAQGRKVFSEVLLAGAERAVNADKPLTVTVGNAASTQLSIDHQPYDLTQATRGRVARIQLK